MTKPDPKRALTRALKLLDTFAQMQQNIPEGVELFHNSIVIDVWMHKGINKPATDTVDMYLGEPIENLTGHAHLAAAAWIKELEVKCSKIIAQLKSLAKALFYHPFLNDDDWRLSLRAELGQKNTVLGWSYANTKRHIGVTHLMDISEKEHFFKRLSLQDHLAQTSLWSGPVWVVSQLKDPRDEGKILIEQTHPAPSTTLPIGKTLRAPDAFTAVSAYAALCANWLLSPEDTLISHGVEAFQAFPQEDLQNAWNTAPWNDQS